MRWSITCLLVMVTATRAAADDDLAAPMMPLTTMPAPVPDRAFVAAGVTVGADHFLDAGFVLDGGVQLPGLPLWVHAAATGGATTDFEGGGPLWRVVAGLEARACNWRGTCLLLGLDAGYQHQTWRSNDVDAPTEEHHGAVVGPRLGVDAALGTSTHARVRAALVLYGYDHSRTPPGMTDGWGSGGALLVTLGYRL